MAKSTAKRAPKKGSTARKVFAFILIIILIGALATSITFNVLMYQKMTSAPINPDTPGINDPDKDHVVVTPDPAISMLSISPDAAIAASDVVSVPVTVTPNIDVKIALDWVVSFKNPQSEWATGKTATDYVTVTSTGERTATVNVLQAFGEQIEARAVLKADTNVSVACTVDYVRKYTFTQWHLKTVEGKEELANFHSVFTPNFDISDGTVDDPDLKFSISAAYSDDWRTFVDLHLRAAYLENNLLTNSEINQLSNKHAKAIATGTDMLDIPFPIWQLDSTNAGEIIGSGLVLASNDVVAAILMDDMEEQFDRFLGLNFNDSNLPFEQWLEKTNKRYTATQKNLFHKGFNQFVDNYDRIEPHYLVEDWFVFNSFIDVAVSVKGKYNNLIEIIHIPLMFQKFTVTPSDMTINPPSIIV